jgi:hypothetical protein
MPVYRWGVETFEKGTDYFKSLKLKYVCEPLPEKKREKLALVISPTEVEEADDDGVDYAETSNDSDGIGASVVKEIGASVGRNSNTSFKDYFPPSKKRLFSDVDSKV